MINTDQKNQYSELLRELSVNLDITETEYNDIVTSYNAMGEWLSSETSPLKIYAPKIRPQGSFMLGTMIRPVSPEGDIDIDLVCQLTKKPCSWTQKDLKDSVGGRIKSHGKYMQMLDKEGKRCWTLKYAQEKYHMDVLPCFVGDNYQTVYDTMFSDADFGDVSGLAIRITDKTRPDYQTEVDVDNWLKSNPFGYAKWFLNIANTVGGEKRFSSIKDSIEAVPKNRKHKLPLQVAVQLMKRHRDIMFEGDDKKPISIIITTLAAKAYQGESSVYDTIHNIIGRMSSMIENRGGVKRVTNPVNNEENFADRWENDPVREQNFYKWLNKIQQDFHLFATYSGQGLPKLKQPLVNMFGDSVTTKAFANYSTNIQTGVSNGKVVMAAGAGMLGATGRAAVPKHNFFGRDDDE